MPKMSPAMERLLAKQAEQRRAAAEGTAAAGQQQQQQSSTATSARLTLQPSAPVSPASPAVAGAGAALLNLSKSRALGGLGSSAGGSSPQPASPYSSAYPPGGGTAGYLSPRSLPPVASPQQQQQQQQQPSPLLNLRASVGAGAGAAGASPLAKKPLPPISQGSLL